MDISELYEASQEGLFRYAMALSHHLDRADDLIQETFVRALQHATTLERLNRFQREAWLKRVLRNRFLDEERTRKRRAQLLRKLITSTATHTRPVDATTYDALLDLVPAAHRNLFEKRYLLGMSSVEIGAALGISAGTVRYRLHLCIQCLRTQLSQHRKGESWNPKQPSET